MQELDAVTVLMSERARREFGGKALQILPPQSRIVTLDALSALDKAPPVDIAFLSRDITGSSTKHRSTPELATFFSTVCQSNRLSWVQTHAAGADRPVYAELRARDVVVTTGSGTAAGPVAQMAIAGLLALARRIPELAEAQRMKKWTPLLDNLAPADLSAQTALIVGVGAIGQQVARLLKALDMRTIGVRTSLKSDRNLDEVVTFDLLARVLPQADWIIISCPLTSVTRGLFNAAAFAALPQGAGIINVARGEIIVEAELLKAMKSGRVGGAFLDVFEYEPLDPSSPLWTQKNLIVSPHTAAHTQGHYTAVGQLFLDNLAAFAMGLPLRNQLP